jgi:hypothetical protein
MHREAEEVERVGGGVGHGANVPLPPPLVGGDVRYRVVTEDMDRNGLLVYGKIGLRF